MDVKHQPVYTKSCTIICNGKLYKNDLAKLYRFKKTNELNKPRTAIDIIACDGASDFLKKSGYTPDVIIGDLDSITPKAAAYFKRRKIRLIKIKDQNTNDLEKAFEYALSKKCRVIHLTGLSGGRLDHTLNNISVLLKYHKKAKLVIHDNGFEGHIITKEYRALCKPCSIVSLIPLPSASGVNSTGLKYPLKNLTLALGHREGALNETISQEFGISLRKGVLLVLVKQLLRGTK